MRTGLSRFRLLAIGWISLVVFIVLLASNKQTSFDSSIMTLLPLSEQQPLIKTAVEKMNKGFSQRLIILLSGDDEKQLKKSLNTFAGNLVNENSTSAQSIKKLTWRVDKKQVETMREELYPYRFSILDKQTRTLLQTDEQRTNEQQAGQYEQLMNKVMLRLYSPLPQPENSLIDDPFGLFTELSQNQSTGLNVSVTDSLLKVQGAAKPTYMLMLELAGAAASQQTQQNILATINEQKLLLENHQIKVMMSGMLLHAAAGAEQAKREISTIGFGSLLGIIILMLYVFRHLKPLLLMLLAVGIGCSFASAITVLVFERVHLITFAFGAGIVGVSIDYALHYLCERQTTTEKLTISRIFPGLLLALFSSVLAYSAQGLTPFPGLQQMAVFSVTGLIGSWLSVVILFPMLTSNENREKLALAEVLYRLRARFPMLKNNTLLIIGLVVLFLISTKIIFSSRSLDDVRLLQTSSKSLLSEEQDVRDLLGINSSSKFILVTADSVEQSLQREEQLAADLLKLKNERVIEGYQLLSQKLPSLQKQKENRQLTRQLYDKELANYFSKLKLSEEKLNAAQTAYDNAEELLTSDRWLNLEVSDSWKELIIKHSEGEVATVIRLNGSIDKVASQQLRVLADSKKYLFYVDQVENISRLLAKYRSQIASWVMAAYIVILVVLSFRYKTQVWRVMFAPVLSSVFTLAALVLIEGGLNLFHFLALILVLGIGLDMGIFLYETKGKPQTWLAVSLSTVTSLLAFGLLALSDTPVLYHFGLTVLIGLLFVWLLAPMVRKNNFGEVYG